MASEHELGCGLNNGEAACDCPLNPEVAERLAAARKKVLSDEVLDDTDSELLFLWGYESGEPQGILNVSDVEERFKARGELANALLRPFGLKASDVTSLVFEMRPDGSNEMRVTMVPKSAAAFEATDVERVFELWPASMVEASP